MPETKVIKKTEKKLKGKDNHLILNVYNKEGKVVGKMELSKDIFGQKENKVLVSQVARAYLDHQKPNIASTKVRSEVSGGGRKPWRQKGTGRARAGSIRAPHWRGGGVVFGPKPTNTKVTAPKKMRQKALAIALSSKFAQGSVYIIDKVDFKEPKTKLAVVLIENMPLKSTRRTLLVLEEREHETKKSFANLQNVELAPALDLSLLSVLKSSSLIFTKGSVERLKERFYGKPAQDN